MKYLKHKSEIEKVLGIKFDIEHIKKVVSLNELPGSVFEQCKMLNDPFLKECFLSYYVTEADERYLRPFVFSAVLKGIPASEWMKGRVLVLGVSLEDILSRSLNDLYSELDVDYSCIISPTYEPRKIGGIAGAFAKIELQSTYKSPQPRGVISVQKNNITTPVNPQDKTIWFRRWIAARMASYLESKYQPFNLEQADKLSELIPYSEWSADAVAALEGLKMEAALGRRNENNIPGYVGSDAYYCGNRHLDPSL
jgi:hypothetical protein